MKKIRNPVLSFCLVLGIFLVLAAVKGFHPFGEYSILQIDLFHQYAPFQEELRSRLLEGKSLIYSWEGVFPSVSLLYGQSLKLFVSADSSEKDRGLYVVSDYSEGVFVGRVLYLLSGTAF